MTLPRNLIAYAYVNGDASDYTVKSVKFAVVRRPIPNGYVADQDEQFDNIDRRLGILESTLKDIELGKQELMKFMSIEEATQWAQENKKSGSIVAIHVNGKWIAHMVEDDYSVTPICNSNGDNVVINLIDGGDGDGYTDEELIQVWDGGGATGY